MRFLKLLLVLIIMLFGAAFALMNAAPVNLNYYFGSQELPLSVVLVGAVIVGVLLGVLAGLGRMAQLKRTVTGLRRELRLASREAEQLRAIPVRDH